MTDTPKEPVFGDIPPVILGLSGLIIAISSIVLLVPVTISNTVMGAMAVQYGPLQLAQPLGPWPPFILHTFVHGGWLHLIMNIFGLLAFGTPIARWLDLTLGQAKGNLAFLVVFFSAALVGALAENAYLLLTNAPSAVLVGASGGLMGLIGILVRLNYGRAITPMPLFSPAVLKAAAPWIGLNILIAFIGMPGVSGSVAWAAHLGGFFVGMLLADLFAPRR
jgi:membrane associated rhomboid family serine protease